jgi:hypothetical protein
MKQRQNNILQIFWTDAHFMKWYPISLTLQTLTLGMKKGLEGQTRAQRQGDFTDNSNIVGWD